MKKSKSIRYLTLFLSLLLALPLGPIRYSFAKSIVFQQDEDSKQEESDSDVKKLAEALKKSQKDAKAANELAKKNAKIIENLPDLFGSMNETDARREERKEESKAAESALNDPELQLDTEAGNKLRDALGPLLNTAKETKIDKNTSKEDVQKVVEAFQEAAKKAEEAKRAATIAYQQSLHDNDNVRAALAKPVTKEWLVNHGKDRLTKVVQGLDPSFESKSSDTEDSLSDLITSVFCVADKNGNAIATVELLSFMQPEFRNKLVEEEGLPPEDVDDVLGKGKEVVDVHRAGADMAEMATSMLMAAFSTGNPYVIAAAIVIIALIAILKDLFGKGGGGGDGGGDGPGDGKGTGSEGRNTGAGDPSRQTGIPNGPLGNGGVARNKTIDLNDSGGEGTADEIEKPMALPEGFVAIDGMETGEYFFAKNGRAISCFLVSDKSEAKFTFQQIIRQSNGQDYPLQSIKKLKSVDAEEPGISFKFDDANGKESQVLRAPDGKYILRDISGLDGKPINATGIEGGIQILNDDGSSKEGGKILFAEMIDGNGNTKDFTSLFKDAKLIGEANDTVTVELSNGKQYQLSKKDGKFTPRLVDSGGER